MESLVVTPFTPNKRSGRGNRTIGIIRALALLGKVEVAYVRLDGGEPDPALVADPAIELRKVSSSRGARRAFLYCEKCLRRAEQGAHSCIAGREHEACPRSTRATFPASSSRR